MPIIAHAILNLKVDEAGIVTLLRSDISKCGCLSLLTESERYNLPIERVRDKLSSMDGVTCSDEKCCITNLTAFSANMKKLAGEE